MEWFDIVDENGEPTGETVERSFAHRNGIRHRTAHVWIFRRTGETMEILLQKRADNKDSFPGCYDISSAGHIPAGTDYIPSALRELEEELGLTVRADQLEYCGIKQVAADDCFHEIPYHDRQVTKIFLLRYAPEMGEFRLQEEEVSEIRWMDFARCMEQVRDNSFRHCIDLQELELLAEYLWESPGADSPQRTG